MGVSLTWMVLLAGLTFGWTFNVAPTLEKGRLGGRTDGMSIPGSGGWPQLRSKEEKILVPGARTLGMLHGVQNNCAAHLYLSCPAATFLLQTRRLK